jgi:hypothetical protein
VHELPHRIHEMSAETGSYIHFKRPSSFASSISFLTLVPCDFFPKDNESTTRTIMREAFVVDPMRVRSLSLRKRSLLRKYAAFAGEQDDEADSLLTSSSTERYVHFVKKPRKKRHRRRHVHFAPYADVVEGVLPDNFTPAEYAALWINQSDYENAKKEFSDTIMAIQVLDSADLLLDEAELETSNHALTRFCVRGCEKYFDLESRYKIRKVVTYKVLQFQKHHKKDLEAVRCFAEALSAECKDLAHYHGNLNAVHCWGSSTEEGAPPPQPRQQTTPEAWENDDASCGIEIVLDPKGGFRALTSVLLA